MSLDRFVIVGLARVRADWFRELSRWSTTAALPVDFVKCVSAEELRARLRSGRSFSAVLIDADAPHVDRDLFEAARTAGAVSIVVQSSSGRDYTGLEPTAVLPCDFSRDDLLAVLQHHCAPIPRIDVAVVDGSASEPSMWRGRLIAVTGPPGMGSSVVAMAMAQSLSAQPQNQGLVVLVDFRLDADLAFYHDARDVVPGLSEFVEAHRRGTPDGASVRGLLHDVEERHYRLLLGLRRHRDWTALRPTTFDAALDTLLRHHRFVVADVGCDLENEQLTGSVEVEERNLIARHTIRAADLTVLVGSADLKGLHRLTRLREQFSEAGYGDSALMTVFNRAPRSPRARAELARAYAEMHPSTEKGPGGVVAFAPERRRIDESLRDGLPLPHAFADPLGTALDAVLGQRESIGGDKSQPVAVDPYRVGHTPEEMAS
ncbi:MAG: hypothetical protein IH940_02120 [Acidobacteria bacterium]|nr:hypothetical protein [Acidobacteriota bacterium]